ncbi:hypothetical protein SGLAD_v1c00390 [Spiroplasma gladiatoris]|uniref:Lipoprotein n=1 Tax=Spiroplasma gladiatoris TaxID=2143 RepID=A0A4P7AIC1_9MOLU|nr:hypothetical protein [Spiroplasma gladiatoris]QBQ07240.1 hypothetical protein SGLAD_v1c00390 [Spiroplasma gladiatoris]
MKKILAFLSFSLSTSTLSTIVVSCSNTAYDLNEIIESDLGEIQGPTELPTLSDIIKAINAKNTEFQLEEDDVYIKKNNPQTLTKATLYSSWKSVKFIGRVVVNYNYINSKKDLSKIENNTILNLDLNIKEEVVKQVTNKIKELLDVDVFEDTDIVLENLVLPKEEKDGSVEVKSIETSEKLFANKSITFVLKLKETKTNINTVIKISKLGEIKDEEEQTILDAINKVNETSFTNQLIIKKLGDGKSANVTAQESSKFEGSVKVTYSLPVIVDKKDLNEVTGEKLKITPSDDNQQESFEATAIKRIKEVLNIDVQKGEDFSVEKNDFVKPTPDKEGSLKITSTSSSKKLIANKSITFIVKYFSV